MATSTYGSPYVESSDLVSGWPAASSIVADRIDDVSLKGNGLNNQTGTTYTTVLTDGGKTVTLSNASAVTVTIPTNASVAYPNGTLIRFTNKGAGVVTIQGAGGVTVNGSKTTLAQDEALTALKLDTNTWVVDGGQSGGFVKITDTTFSASSAVNVNNCFTSTYDNYRLVLEISGSTGNNVQFRMRLSGTDDTTANYAYSYVFNNGTTPTAGKATAQTLSWFFTGATSSAIGTYDIAAPNLVRATTMAGIQNFAGSVCEVISWANLHDVATAYDGISLIPSTGTISGTLRIYGYGN